MSAILNFPIPQYAQQRFLATLTGEPQYADLFDHALSFLDNEELARTERICRSWQNFTETIAWKTRCHSFLHTPNDQDLPPGDSYKERFRLAHSSIYGERAYSECIAPPSAKVKTEPAPPIPQAIALSRWNKPDPCWQPSNPDEPVQTIGQNYVWLYIPSSFEITVGKPPKGAQLYLDLEKPVNPDELDRLTMKRIRKDTPLPEKERVLKVANTIRNLNVLVGDKFQEAFLSEPSNPEWDKKIPSGWICMRKTAILESPTTHTRSSQIKSVEIGHWIPFLLLHWPLYEANVVTSTLDQQNNPLICRSYPGGLIGIRTTRAAEANPAVINGWAVSLATEPVAQPE